MKLRTSSRTSSRRCGRRGLGGPVRLCSLQLHLLERDGESGEDGAAAQFVPPAPPAAALHGYSYSEFPPCAAPLAPGLPDSVDQPGQLEPGRDEEDRGVAQGGVQRARQVGALSHQPLSTVKQKFLLIFSPRFE